MIDRLVRLAWTGLSFTLFGLGALLFGLLYFPLLMLLVRDRQRRQDIARRSVSRLFRFFIGFMGLLVLTWRVDGLDQVGDTRRTLVVANHPSLIDAVFLIALFPGADCVVKAAHWRNPLMRFAVQAANYIPNLDNEVLITTAIERLEQGGCLVLFPEGTRTRQDQPSQFKRGAAVIAARAAADILPVRICCSPPTLRKGEPWYRIPAQKPHWTLEALPRIRPDDWQPADRSEKQNSIELTEVLKSRLACG